VKHNLRDIEWAMQQNWPECRDAASLALLKVTRLQDLFKQEVEACVTTYELKHADFSALATLRRSPPPYCLSPTELYQSLLFSSGGLTKVLKRLEEAGLVERLDNPLDKRSKLVQLNQQGKRLVEQVMPKLHQKNQTLLQGLSKSEQLQFNQLLQKVLDHHDTPFND